MVWVLRYGGFDVVLYGAPHQATPKTPSCTKHTRVQTIWNLDVQLELGEGPTFLHIENKLKKFFRKNHGKYYANEHVEGVMRHAGTLQI